VLRCVWWWLRCVCGGTQHNIIWAAWHLYAIPPSKGTLQGYPIKVSHHPSRGEGGMPILRNMSAKTVQLCAFLFFHAFSRVPGAPHTTYTSAGTPGTSGHVRARPAV